MTVEEPTIGIAGFGTQGVRCQWFSGNKLGSGVFPIESLKPAKKAASE